MGEGACQLDILDRPSWGCELTFEQTAVVTSINIDDFLLVTTRSIVHPGRFACIPNCVGEFGTDIGQPLVTSNVMSNHLSYHHKAYYTYSEMYIQMYNAMYNMDTWENFHPQQNLSFLVSKGPY